MDVSFWVEMFLGGNITFRADVLFRVEMLLLGAEIYITFRVESFFSAGNISSSRGNVLVRAENVSSLGRNVNVCL